MSYGSFNAQEFQPNNGGAAMHPPGIFVGTISNAEIKPTKDGNSGMYVVTFKSDKGEATTRYNLWNQNAQAVEIARGQLSSLCHAINYYHLNFDADGGRSLIGAPLMFEVGAQMVPSDPNDARSQKMPSATLTEVKRVFSSTGINPARPSDAPVVPTEGSPAPAATQAPATTAAPFTPPASAPQPQATPPAAPPVSPPAPAWQQPAAPAAGVTAKPPWER